MLKSADSASCGPVITSVFRKKARRQRVRLGLSPRQRACPGGSTAFALEQFRNARSGTRESSDLKSHDFSYKSRIRLIPVRRQHLPIGPLWRRRSVKVRQGTTSRRCNRCVRFFRGDPQNRNKLTSQGKERFDIREDAVIRAFRLWIQYSGFRRSRI